MSLGVRFKLCLAIWASLQVLSPASGLKMQVTNLSSSPTPLSAGDLSTSASVSSPQIITNSKTLPNVPVKRFDSFTSPLNVVGPTVDAPMSLSIPNLNFQNGGNDIRILKTKDSGTDSVISSIDDMADLIPAENNIVPNINYGNRILSNVKPNNFPVTPNFGAEINSENNIRNLEPIKPGNNENRPRSSGPRMLTVFGQPSSSKTSPEISINNEIKPNNNNGNIFNNIPKIHQSFGPISTEKGPVYLNNGFNSIPNAVNNNHLGGISNIQATDVNPFNLNPPEISTVVNNAIPAANIPLLNDISQKQNNFARIPNNQIIPILPENIRNQLKGVINQEQVYGQNNGAVNVVNQPEMAPQEHNFIQSLSNPNALNNMNQNGIVQQQTQFSRIENPQPIIFEKLPDFNDNVNTLNNLQMLNNDKRPPQAPILPNNVSPFNLMNEVRPYTNNNNFYNLQRVPSAINDQIPQKEVQVVLNDNNNNLIVEAPNNILNDIGNRGFDKIFERWPPIMPNSPPLTPINVPINNQILEQTRNNLGNNIQSNNQIQVINQNNINFQSIADKHVTSFSPRNPFLDVYKSPINMMENKLEERQVVPEPIYTLNNVERESIIANQNINYLPSIPSNPTSGFIPQFVPNDSQENFKPSPPKFIPKITSVFSNFNAPIPLSSDTESISFINPGPSSGTVNAQQISTDSVVGKLPVIEPNFIPSNPFPHTSPVPPLSMSNSHPSFSPTSEIQIANSIKTNPYFNEFNSQNSPPQTIFGNWPPHMVVDPFPNTELPLVSPSSEYGSNNYHNPSQSFNFQPSPPQIEMGNLPINNPGIPSNSFQPISFNPGQYTSLPETYEPLTIPSNPYNNVNPQPVFNYAEPSFNSVILPSQEFVSNYQNVPSNVINIPPNNAGTIIQGEFLNPYFNIPVEAPIPSVPQSFDNSNTFESVINEVPAFNSGFTPYASPFNPVYNNLQSMPNNIVSIEPTTVLDNSFTPIYYTQPQAVFTENLYSPPNPNLQNVEITNVVPVQPNIIPHSTYNPSFGLANEIQYTPPLNIPSFSQENIPPPNILANSQQYLSIPEISASFNGFNSQNSFPKVSITQELPYMPQNNFNLQPEPNLISPVSNLPNVYTSNAIQQFLPSIQYLPPSVSYTNVSPSNQFSSISDLGSVVAKNVLNNLISKKLNSKAAQYIPVANLPPVNPYLPKSFYPSPLYYEPVPMISTIPSFYDQAIPMISTLPSPNLNIAQFPNYDYFEIPDYFIDYTDLVTFPEVPEMSEIPDVYDFENEIKPFIPYMSSLKVNVLPVIEGVSLEPILPNNILANVHPNVLTPYPNTPYPVSQLDLSSLKTKCRDSKEFERLISLFVLSELINGNENRDWEGLEKIIALLCVT